MKDRPQGWVPVRGSARERGQGWATAKGPVRGWVSEKAQVMVMGLALELEAVECLCPAKFQEHAGQTKGLPLALGM